MSRTASARYLVLVTLVGHGTSQEAYANPENPHYRTQYAWAGECSASAGGRALAVAYFAPLAAAAIRPAHLLPKIAAELPWRLPPVRRTVAAVEPYSRRRHHNAGMRRKTGRTAPPPACGEGAALAWCVQLVDRWPLSALASWPPAWWISGGLALALHFDRAWRPHADVDLALRALPATFAVLADPPEDAAPWAVELAARCRELQDLEAVNLRLRASPTGPPVHIHVLHIVDDAWRPTGRLQPTVPWDEAVLRSAARVPYLAPDLVLLLKSSIPRAWDNQDAQNAMTFLDPVRRARLLGWLPREHPWLSFKHDDRSD